MALIAGILQGVTEFLPISSSGHLVLFHDILGFSFSDDLAFDVVLHLGTLMALLLFFRREILIYLKAFCQSFRHWNLKNDSNQRLAWYLLAATLPAGLAGYLWQDQIENSLRSVMVVVVTLIGFGIVLYSADKLFAKVREITELHFGSALLIGLAQAVALVPGVSRSGITIIAGLTQKLKREAAARFSFLLSIPIVFGAGIKKISDLFSGPPLASAELISLILGFLSSALVGYFCIKYFLKFLQNHSLKVFAYYRILLGLIILVIWYFQ